MSTVRRTTLILPLLLAGLLYSVPASAQVDFTGVWNGNTNAEDGPERLNRINRPGDRRGDIDHTRRRNFAEKHERATFGLTAVSRVDLDPAKHGLE